MAQLSQLLLTNQNERNFQTMYQHATITMIEGGTLSEYLGHSWGRPCLTLVLSSPSILDSYYSLPVIHQRVRVSTHYGPSTSVTPSTHV